MLCPRCNSADAVQSVRDIYESGTSNAYTQGTGVGYGGHGQWGVGYAQMNTTQQTLLAQRLSPPNYGPILPAWIKLGLMFLLYPLIAYAVQTIYPSLWEYKDINTSDEMVFVFGKLFTTSNLQLEALALGCGLLFLLLLVCLWKQAFPGRAKRQQRNSQMQAWNNSNYCHRCGCQF